MRNQQTVIIKRSSRRRDTSHPPGGAWKVAFADFTMAMMALFLILWILSASTQDEREVISEALRNYSVFSGSPNPFELGKRPYPFELEGYPSILRGVAEQILTSGTEGAGISMHNQQRAGGDIRSGSGDGDSLTTFFESPFYSLESMIILGDLFEEIGKQLQAMDNLAVDVVPHGLRIRLQASDEREMFTRGGAELQPFFEDMLMAMSPVFVEIDNSLIISGHTDSIPYVGAEYTNWELSGDRALMARQIMEIGGMPADRVLQVVAMSDGVPADESDSIASANRRIEILILTEKAEAELKGLFDYDIQDSVINQAHDRAERNQPVTR